MPLPVIEGCYRVSIEGRCSNGQPWANVLHFDYSAQPTETNARNAINAALIQLYQTGGLDTYVANNVSFDQARYTPLDGDSASVIVPWGFLGAATDESLPPANAVCVSHRTGKRGPRYRGRTYLPQFSRGFITDAGELSTATAANITSLWNTMATTLSALTEPILFVIASYKFATMETVNSSTCNVELDTQRRRRLQS